MTSNNIFFSIIIPTYNPRKFIQRLLTSITHNECLDKIEVIISDDCSTDSTRDILNEYVNKDNRIVVFLQEKNLGIVKNFEYLIQKVENEAFMFSDQDDIWKKDKIEENIFRSVEGVNLATVISYKDKYGKIHSFLDDYEK